MQLFLKIIKKYNILLVINYFYNTIKQKIFKRKKIKLDFC